MANNDRENRLKRIRAIKRIVVLMAIVMLVVPTIFCLFLSSKINRLEKLISEKEFINSDTIVVDNAPVLEKRETVSVNVIEDSFNDSNVEPNDEFNNDSIENLKSENEQIKTKKIYLTFDDGPSYNTDAILDVLRDYGIKATFFVTGHEGYEKEYKRIVDEGHTIGMHSYTHQYRSVYKDLDSFADDLYDIQSYIMDVTGVSCDFYRFPGGSSNKVCRVDMNECISYLNAKGITYFDWNVSGLDAVSGGASVNSIVNNVINGINKTEDDIVIVLLHDCGDKKTTVEALPIIIEKIANMDNVEFLPIDENTVPIQHEIN